MVPPFEMFLDAGSHGFPGTVAPADPFAQSPSILSRCAAETSPVRLPEPCQRNRPAAVLVMLRLDPTSSTLKTPGPLSVPLWLTEPLLSTIRPVPVSVIDPVALFVNVPELDRVTPSSMAMDPWFRAPRWMATGE